MINKYDPNSISDHFVCKTHSHASSLILKAFSFNLFDKKEIYVDGLNLTINGGRFKSSMEFENKYQLEMCFVSFLNHLTYILLCILFLEW